VTTERLVAFAKEQNSEAFVTIWDSLTIREQRMIATALAAMIAHLRSERGDPPDAEYGPSDPAA
jgi:hypothetical protein